MIDVVYVLGTGSRFHNNEIRFSLRSIEKHLSNYRKIWIVGEHHPMLENVNFVPFPDKTSMSDTNIMHKVSHACQHPEITDDFLFFNDDHYLLADFDAPTFPYFYSKSMEEYLRRRPQDGYRRRVKNTYKYLQSKGLPTKFFDTHTPIIFNKAKFLEHVNTGPDWSSPTSFVVKSIYANSLNIEGVLRADWKKMSAPEGVEIFSTTPRVSAAVQRFLLERFPKRCKFELCDFGQEAKDVQSNAHHTKESRIYT